MKFQKELNKLEKVHEIRQKCHKFFEKCSRIRKKLKTWKGHNLKKVIKMEKVHKFEKKPQKV